MAVLRKFFVESARIPNDVMFLRACLDETPPKSQSSLDAITTEPCPAGTAGSYWALTASSTSITPPGNSSYDVESRRLEITRAPRPGVRLRQRLVGASRRGGDAGYPGAVVAKEEARDLDRMLPRVASAGRRFVSALPNVAVQICWCQRVAPRSEPIGGRSDPALGFWVAGRAAPS